MSKAMKILFLLALCSLVIAVPSLWAYWVTDGVPLCAVTGNQTNPQITSDGAGGAIVTWEDYRSGNADIYAQRVSAAGTPLWMTNGVPVCTVTGDQSNPQITSDGAGGAIVTWSDGNTYAQRVDASGAVRWTANGVPICTVAGGSLSVQLTSDGAGGAIVTWVDYRSGDHIYAQRVNALGTVLWTPNGVALCTGGSANYNPTIISDGVSGAIVTWDEWGDIYAQRVNASGAVQWTATGVVLCAAYDQQTFPTITSDGAGGAIVTWRDNRSGYLDIYVQRVNASGVVQWPANGVALCTASYNQTNPTIITDGAGGAIVTWYDNRSSGEYDIYTQRVNASGAVRWAANGVALCTAAGSHYSPMITSDGAGGAIVTWYDNRSGNYNIYAQRVNASGTAQWITNGVPLCAATGDQITEQITSDGAGGAIVTWQDNRSTSTDIYAQRVDANGFAPPKSPRTPQGLAGRPIYNNNTVVALLITWNRNIESNISHYEVYRDSIEDFVPGPGNLLASPSDTFLYDVQWRWFPHRYYKVGAVDSNGLRSDFAVLRPDDVTGTETPKAPAASYLSQNYPNPFNPMTRIAYGLSAPGHVSLRIYDVAGRLVRMLAEGNRPAANYAEVWDGKDAGGRMVASGIYFCRFDAGSFTQTRKMILLR